MSKSFCPMLAPNEEIDISTLKYPMLVSFKIDGIRAIFKDGEMYSRALKQFPNIKLRERFVALKLYAKENKMILDGELYCKSLTFNELSGLTHRLDEEIPKDLYFYCFDMIRNESFETPFITRILSLTANQDLRTKGFYCQRVEQEELFNYKEVEEYYKKALEWGCDGLILRDREGRYKFGRGTVKEGLIYKLKPFRTFDAQIIGIEQATEVDPKAEKKINELGRSVTSKKKADRILIEKASAFLVMYEGKELKVCASMTDEEKEEVWKNKEKYVGRWIEYKGMLVGSKDLPRHPNFIRWRIDKE